MISVICLVLEIPQRLVVDAPLSTFTLLRIWNQLSLAKVDLNPPHLPLFQPQLQPQARQVRISGATLSRLNAKYYAGTASPTSTPTSTKSTTLSTSTSTPPTTSHSKLSPSA